MSEKIVIDGKHFAEWQGFDFAGEKTIDFLTVKCSCGETYRVLKSEIKTADFLKPLRTQEYYDRIANGIPIPRLEDYGKIRYVTCPNCDKDFILERIEPKENTND